jgi:hypothetical protein
VGSLSSRRTHRLEHDRGHIDRHRRDHVGDRDLTDIDFFDEACARPCAEIDPRKSLNIAEGRQSRATSVVTTESSVSPVATSFSEPAVTANNSQAVKTCDFPGLTTRALATNRSPIAGRKQLTE